MAKFYAILGVLMDSEWGVPRPLGIIEQEDRAILAIKKVEWNFDGTFSMEEIDHSQIAFYQEEIDKALFNELSESERKAANLLAHLKCTIPYDLAKKTALETATIAESSDETRLPLNEQENPAEHLNRNQKRALEIIGESGPISAKVLAKRLSIAESTVRKHVIPVLKPLGVRNDGDGYYVARV